MSSEAVQLSSTMASSPPKMRGSRDPPERRDPRELTKEGSPVSVEKNQRHSQQAEQRLPSPTRSSQREASDTIPNSQELICDYDASPTTLYSLLEASDWRLAVTRCKTHPNEVRTWVVRRDRETTQVRWTLLPIHAAVIFQSPNYVVEVLIEKYLGAVSRRDDQGMLPLHLAFRHNQGNEDLMHLLLSHYPKALHVKDHRGRTPLELGRDDTYSAKLMQLYANACVTLASQAQVGENARSIFAAAKEYETTLAAIKEDYVLQIKRLTDVYENRIALIDDKHKGDIQRLREEARVERRQLVELHHEEMTSLHEVAASTREQENSHQKNETTQKLEALQAEVKRYKLQAEQLTKQLESKNSFIKDASEQITAISEEQARLQSTVERQEKDREAAHSIRLQLLKTLLKQEEEDVPSHTTHVDVVNKLLQTTQLRVENMKLKLAHIDTESKISNDEAAELYRVAKEVEAQETEALDEEEKYEEYPQGEEAELNEDECYEEFAHVEPDQEDDISAMTDHSNFLS
jgi:hypothetical protein